MPAVCELKGIWNNLRNLAWINKAFLSLPLSRCLKVHHQCTASEKRVFFGLLAVTFSKFLVSPRAPEVTQSLNRSALLAV